jgi:hypothetical protein
MTQLPADYLLDIARQVAFVSAFLGGFSATFLGTLLYSGSDSRLANWAISSTALSACAFIVAVLALTMLTVGLNPSAPAGVIQEGALRRAQLIGLLSFLLGMYALLFSIGASGWLRSRKLGWTTTCIAVAAALLATLSVVG